MPKVTLGRFTEKDKRFVKNVKAGLIQHDKTYKDLAARSDTSPKTVYERYKQPANMTVQELRAYITVSGLSQEAIIDFLYEGH